MKKDPMKKSLMILIMMSTVFTYLTIFENIYASQEQDQSASLMPFGLLFNPDCKNSIIICGVKPSICNKENTRNNSEDSLLMFAKNGIDAFQKEIEGKNLRIFVFANCQKYNEQKPYSRDIILYKKQQGPKKGHKSMMTTRIIEGYREINNLINDRTCMVYNIPWYENDSYDKAYANHVYGKLAKNKIPCLLLIDDTLLKQYENIEKKVHDRFNGEKKIITCNPYAGTIKRYSHPQENLTSYAIPCTYFFVIAVLGLAYYYNPEIGKYWYCLDALQYGSLA